MSGRPSSRFFPFLFVFLVTLASGVDQLRAQAPDQGPSVAVTGTVTDRSGGLLPGTAIEAIIRSRTVATTTTGPDGRYRLDVPAGVLVQLRARRDGFADQTVDLHTVSARADRDIVLGIGAVTDTVVVTASRTAESRATSTESISVLDAVDIASLGSSQLGDIVRWVPGLNVESSRPRRCTGVALRAGR